MQGLENHDRQQEGYGPLQTSWAGTFIYLFFPVLDKFFLRLCHMPGTVLGAAHPGMNTTALIPALMGLTVYEERLRLNKLNC